MAKLTSDSVACMMFLKDSRADRFFSNVVLEEFVLRSLRAFPLEASFYAWSSGSR